MARTKTKQAQKGTQKSTLTDQPTILIMGGARNPVERAGGTVRQVSYSSKEAAQLIESGKIDGLLLTGGGDVNPRMYTDNPHPRCYGIDDSRDEAEYSAIVAADAAGIPMMGICRGAQMLNVVFGGTLDQNITDNPETHKYHQGHDHRVKAAEGSRLAGAWGKTEEDRVRYVISIHHQAVGEIAPGFVATGFALDGTIEAIESIEGWILGVQFHPEMASSDYQQKIFDRFVQACAVNRGMTWKKPQPKKETSSRGWAYGRQSETEWRQPKPKKNSGRQPTWATPVLTSWMCFRCNIKFDEKVDHTDHMLFFHGVPEPVSELLREDDLDLYDDGF